MGNSYQNRHAQRWHQQTRDQAWWAKAQGVPKIIELLRPSKYESHTETHYNAERVGYDIVVEVFPKHATFSRYGEPVLVHREPFTEFPSDHLMTKLILLVG